MTTATGRRFEEVKPTVGRFVNATDKLAMAGCAVKIVDTIYQPRATFGPRWLVTVAIVGSGELVDIDFAANDARNGMFQTVRETLASGESFDPVVLLKEQPDGGGNPYWTFRSATPAEIAAQDVPEWPEAPGDAPVATGPKLRRGGKATTK